MSKPTISNVEIHYQSHSMISLGWDDQDGFKYHIWLIGPYWRDTAEQVLFKNRDNTGLKSWDKAYYRCRHLDATNKANAKMIAEARAIADAAGMFDLAKATFEAKEAAEQTERTERIRKNKRAKELFAEMQAYLDCTTEGVFRLDADDMACLLIYRPVQS